MSETMTRVRYRDRSFLQNQAAPAAPDSRRRLQVVEQLPERLHPATRRTRIAGKGQIAKLEANIERFGCVIPIPVTPDGEIIDGHSVWQACKNLGRTVPTVLVDGLTDAEVRALRLALNRMAELSRWDDDALRDELASLFVDDPDLLSFTGFDAAEIDARLAEVIGIDELGQTSGSGLPHMSAEGDLWCFEGGHRLLQGNAREAIHYQQVCGTERAQALISDMPYGCKISGHASQSHSDFLDGAGLNETELHDLCSAYLRNSKTIMAAGALAYTFMDGRGLHTLMSAAAAAKLHQIALCVWDKVNPGMGSFYRQQAEFIPVCKFDDAKHLNNIALGKNRRNRSNVWSYPGLAGFGKGRASTIAMHPTVKPIGLIADIILDCTKRHDIVFDPFAGSGTILLAAHRTTRRAFAIELDPKYIDVAVHRMEQFVGAPARLEATGLTYAATMKERAG